MTRPILLRHALVLQRAGSVPARLDILISGSRVTSVDAQILPSGAEDIVDLSGFALVPGFFNAHYHSHDALAKGLFDSAPLEEWSIVAGGIGRGRSVEEVRVRTLLGAIECLRNGFTTVQDFVNLARMDDAYVDAMVDAYAQLGIRVVFAISVRDRSQLDTIPWSRELVPQTLHAALNDAPIDGGQQLRFVERQLSRHPQSPERLSWAVAASAPHRCSPRLLRDLGELADRWSLPVYTHLYETRLQRAYARHALAEHRGSVVRYMSDAGLLGPNVTVAHAVWTSGDEIEQLAATGSSIALNMLSNMRLGSGLAPIADYRRAGVNLALGGDNLSCSDVQSPFQAMKQFCLLASLEAPGSPPTAADALHAATIAGARTAALESQLGAIEPGMLADIVAVDLTDPAYQPLNDLPRQLVFSETGRAVRHVWVGGRAVVRDGRCTLVDESEVMQSVEALMPAVRRDLAPLFDRMTELQPSLRRIMARAQATDTEGSRYLDG